MYYQNQDRSIYKIENGNPLLVIDHKLLNDKGVVGVYKDGPVLTIILEDAEFLKFQNEKIISFPIDADSALIDLNVYCTERLKDGSFILGTISKGMPA